MALLTGAALVLAACNGLGGTEGHPAAASSTRPSSGTSPSSGSDDWPTYHRSPARSGFDPGSPTFSGLQPKWTSARLDGAVYAQPLVVGDEVLVATENDSVYALRRTDGSILWRTHLGPPVPGSSLVCGNINPSGITGTPAVGSGTLYVVAFVNPGHHVLFALNAATGAVEFKRDVDAPGSDPLLEQQRAALLAANGRVYVSYGGLFGDCGQYHGWVVSAPATGSGDLRSFRVATRGGAIWGTSGPAMLGSEGDLYIATGNSFTNGRFDGGDGVIRLSPTLQLESYFAPPNWKTLNKSDLDLGSTGPLPVSGGLIFQIGKQGVGYLLRASALGGIGGQVFSGQVCSGAYGAGAYHAGYIYVPCMNGLYALRLGSGPSFTVAWHGDDFFAGPPVVSPGAVYTTDRNDGRLYALDPATGKVLDSVSIGSVMHFASPALSAGDLYVAAGGTLQAFSGA